MTRNPFAAIKITFGSWGDPAIGTLLCPACGGDMQHVKEPVRTLHGQDAYKVDWGGRGDLLVIPFWGECGSRWELSLGFHKGSTGVFARVIESCKANNESA